MLFTTSFFPTFAAYSLSWLLGYSLLLKYFKNSLSPSECFFIAPSIGFFITSLILFTGLIIGELNAFNLILFHFIFLTLFWTPALFKISKKSRKPHLLIPIAIAMTLIFLNAAKSPFGAGMDVWAIWKLKATFIFRDPESWTNIFSPIIKDSHPEYPIFYPLCIVWGWVASKKETFIAPLLLTTLFSLAQIGLLTSFINQKKFILIILPLLLVSTPQWTGMAASQYADPIMAYHILCGFILMKIAVNRRSDQLALLTGIVCGIGAFVKDEGLLFFTIATLYFLITNKLLLLNFLKGSVILIILLIAFKLYSSSDSQTLSFNQIYLVIENNLFLQRLKTTVFFMVRCMAKENYWIYGWFFCLSTLLLCSKRLLAEYKAISAVILLQIIGYVAVYVFTPLELAYHLQTSVDRVLYQVYPTVAYLAWVIFWDVDSKLLRQVNPVI